MAEAEPEQEQEKKVAPATDGGGGVCIDAEDIQIEQEISSVKKCLVCSYKLFFRVLLFIFDQIVGPW